MLILLLLLLSLPQTTISSAFINNNHHQHRNSITKYNLNYFPSKQQRRQHIIVYLQEEGTTSSTDNIDTATNNNKNDNDDNNTNLPIFWERYEGVEICFPDTTDSEPKAILHFIGGTGLALFPKQSYSPLLESLAAKNYLVVATPVSVFTSPFDHYALAQEIAFSFHNTYIDIIEDEYGEAIAEELPIVGVGHSLGARLHLLLNLDDDDDGNNSNDSIRSYAFERDANIFIGFNNYSASKSVPLLDEMSLVAKGLQAGLSPIGGVLSDGYGFLKDRLQREIALDSDAEFILKGLKYVEALPQKVLKVVSEEAGKQQLNRRRKTSANNQRQSRRKGTRRGRRRGTSDDDDDEAQKTEFDPSPSELWDAVLENYKVTKNLVVQFNSDTLDQSPKLAAVLKAAQVDDGRGDYLRYALLDGIHLTPVARKSKLNLSVNEDEYDDDYLDEESDEEDEDSVDGKVRDLIDTISSYIDIMVVGANSGNVEENKTRVEEVK